MGIETVFFDVGDTLVFRRESVPATVVRVCGELGIAAEAPPDINLRIAEYYHANRREFFTAEGIHRFVEIYLRFILSQIGAAEVSLGDFDRIYDEVDYIGSRHYELFPETLEALRAAREGFARIAVVSNWNVYLEKFLENMGLLKWFEFVIISDVVGSWKPDPRIFQVALGCAGVSADTCCYIGNSYGEDVVGARAAGITPLLIARNGAPAADCPSFRNLRDAVDAAMALR